MNLNPVVNRFEQKQWTRVVAFGSSNTERYLAGMHWFDWLEIGLKHTHGRIGHFVNAGLGGDTCRGLLERFIGEVALYQPDVVIITIGGNDAGLQTGINESEFAASLRSLIAKTREIDAYPILQTYYAQKLEQDDPARAERFFAFMQIVRDTAADANCGLVDHLSRWELLRLERRDEFERLMLNPHHVNELGNMVLGLDLVRSFGLSLNEESLTYAASGIRVQKLLDQLSKHQR